MTKLKLFIRRFRNRMAYRLGCEDLRTAVENASQFDYYVMYETRPEGFTMQMGTREQGYLEPVTLRSAQECDAFAAGMRRVLSLVGAEGNLQFVDGSDALDTEMAKFSSVRKNRMN